MRAAIFIDAGHFLVQTGEQNIEPDYAKLADFFLAPIRRAVPLDLLRCYFYYCPPWMSHSPTEIELRRKAEWDKFVGELESLDRWQVRLGKLEKRREGGRDVYSQKRVDVLLSVDMVRHAAAGHLQHAILVAGDSDFIPAVEAVKESGATVTLWAAPDKSAHLDLIRAADEVQFIDWSKVPQKSKGKSAGTAAKATRGMAKSAGSLVRAFLTSKTPPAAVEKPVTGFDDSDEVPDVRPAPSGRTPTASPRGRGGRGRSTAATAPAAPTPHREPVRTREAPPPAPDQAQPEDNDEASGGPDAPKKKRRRGRRGGRGRNKRSSGAPPADSE